MMKLGDRSLSSSSLSLAKPKGPLSQEKLIEALVKHLTRDAIVVFAFLFVAFSMTFVQVLVDNEALNYFFDVHTAEDWRDFNLSMAQIQQDYHLGKKFPSILISTKYGGKGTKGKLPADLVYHVSESRRNSTDPDVNPLVSNDVVFQNVVSRAPQMFYISDVVCKMFMAITFIFIIILPYFGQLRARRRRAIPLKRMFLTCTIRTLIVLRRILCVGTLVYLLRAMLLRLMILPSEYPMCTPILRPTFAEKLHGTLRVIGGLEITCYDFIFSGHTALTTILAWFWSIYTVYFIFPSKHKSSRFIRYLVLWVVRIFSLTFLSMVVLFLLYSKSHYTLDVILGLIMGTLIFWIWHFLISLYSSMEQHPDERISPRQIIIPIVSMNWLLKLSRWIDGGELEGAREGDDDFSDPRTRDINIDTSDLESSKREASASSESEPITLSQSDGP